VVVPVQVVDIVGGNLDPAVLGDMVHVDDASRVRVTMCRLINRTPTHLGGLLWRHVPLAFVVKDAVSYS